ncbi:hypothetical protein C1645_764586 [Glomus cerebriforme]|uniref:Uncharacterized protein n=1 Tax=Glomus cerebriforme TaxID=658196 RepID=A0A397TCE9_9GLOM|nr:hypothetical protein C1645_764586 [Glomus cerebriforme]
MLCMRRCNEAWLEVFFFDSLISLNLCVVTVVTALRSIVYYYFHLNTLYNLL